MEEPRALFGIAAQAMRRILIDYAKAQHRDKRGGGAPLLELDDNVAVAGGRTLELIALDDALNALAKLDPRQSQLVEMRYFGGLSIDEIIEVMDTSKATYHRYWDTARAFLALELSK